MEKAFLSDEMNSNTRPKVAVIAFPWPSQAPYKFLSDVLKILEPISNKIVLIDGNTERIEISSEKVDVRDIGINVHYLKDIEPAFYSAILWIIKCILAQVKASFKMVQAKNDVDCVIFYMAYPYYLLPLITSKLLKKKTVEVITRSKSNSPFSKIINLQDPILFRLLDGISPESNALVKELGLDKYKNKLLPEGARFIDVSRFSIKKRLSKRKKIVGFVGRIRKEKGVKEFVRAIPLIAKENKDVRFLIGGSGDLLNWVKEECNNIEKENNIKITITGFIKDEDFPSYLNELKLLVLPTVHAEGLPTIILEAMACGTSVLASPVGAIQDIIRNGENGFIMQSTTPKCIAENVLMILEYKELRKISDRARDAIVRGFTYNKAIERWQQMIAEVME